MIVAFHLQPAAQITRSEEPGEESQSGLKCIQEQLKIQLEPSNVLLKRKQQQRDIGTEKKEQNRT